MVGKIYARVVCDRLRLITDAVLMDEQGDFRVRRVRVAEKKSSVAE